MYQLGDLVSLQRCIGIFGSYHTTLYMSENEAIYYPCNLCDSNVMYLYKDHEIICKHLGWSGFIDNYFIWSKNSEAHN
jgi:hypothetical protein